MLNHVLGFRPLSRPLTVTAMDGPMIIKELDHKPAVYYYDKYIHTPDFQEQSLPFPLIQQYDGYDHAHLPQGRTLDGGILFNIRCTVGTELRLSYGDPELMLSETKKIWEDMHAFGGESAHILSCAARYQFPIRIWATSLRITTMSPLLLASTPTEKYTAQGSASSLPI